MVKNNLGGINLNIFIKVLNKKIPLGITLTIALVAAAIAYSISYNIAMKKFNSVVSYNYEKQQMYSKLSEIDYAIRQEYVGNMDEEKLIEGICNGYIEGIDDIDCKYYTESDYKQYISEKNSVGNPINYEKISENTGYIKINNLSSDISSSFISAMQSLQLDGKENIILDLRNVKGGEVDSVAKMLDYILPSGDIVNAIDKKGEKQVVYKSTTNGIECKIAVICNGYTSGISEVVAAVLRDSANAKIIGSTTSGKAIKQKNLQLSDGSVIIFPIAYYVTQSGNAIYGNGIFPDLEVSINSEKNEMLSNGILAKDDDDQLQAALSYLGNQ